MTRELAISLVNASRVFEVLVAVVLIGEHLAAPLTLIPSAVCKHHTNFCNTSLLYTNYTRNNLTYFNNYPPYVGMPGY